MKKVILFLVTGNLLGSCCYSQFVNQLPDQVYFANDSCEYYLPDYTKVVTPTDNCEVSYFYQYPMSGSVLNVGTVTEVSIVAGDPTGNERTIKFSVVVVDTIPPSFVIDTVLLNSLSHYQDEIRTFHFVRWITARGDTLVNPSGFGFWGYYTNYDVLTLDVAKGTFMGSTFVPWNEVSPDHPLYLVER